TPKVIACRPPRRSNAPAQMAAQEDIMFHKVTLIRIFIEVPQILLQHRHEPPRRIGKNSSECKEPLKTGHHVRVRAVFDGQLAPRWPENNFLSDPPPRQSCFRKTGK